MPVTGATTTTTTTTCRCSHHCSRTSVHTNLLLAPVSITLEVETASREKDRSKTDDFLVDGGGGIHICTDTVLYLFVSHRFPPTQGMFGTIINHYYPKVILNTIMWFLFNILCRSSYHVIHSSIHPMHTWRYSIIYSIIQ